ncbi:replication factor C subunit 1, partial [Dionaea muscipula]
MLDQCSDQDGVLMRVFYLSLVLLGENQGYVDRVRNLLGGAGDGVNMLSMSVSLPAPIAVSTAGVATMDDVDDNSTLVADPRSLLRRIEALASIPLTPRWRLAVVGRGPLCWLVLCLVLGVPTTLQNSTLFSSMAELLVVVTPLSRLDHRPGWWQCLDGGHRSGRLRKVPLGTIESLGTEVPPRRCLLLTVVPAWPVMSWLIPSLRGARGCGVESGPSSVLVFKGHVATGPLQQLSKVAGWMEDQIIGESSRAQASLESNHGNFPAQTGDLDVGLVETGHEVSQRFIGPLSDGEQAGSGPIESAGAGELANKASLRLGFLSFLLCVVAGASGLTAAKRGQGGTCGGDARSGRGTFRDSLTTAAATGSNSFGRLGLEQTRARYNSADFPLEWTIDTEKLQMDLESNHGKGIPMQVGLKGARSSGSKNTPAGNGKVGTCKLVLKPIGQDMNHRHQRCRPECDHVLGKMNNPIV